MVIRIVNRQSFGYGGFQETIISRQKNKRGEFCRLQGFVAT